jgi:hypothetical protein
MSTVLADFASPAVDDIGNNLQLGIFVMVDISVNVLLLSGIRYALVIGKVYSRITAANVSPHVVNFGLRSLVILSALIQGTVYVFIHTATTPRWDANGCSPCFLQDSDNS